MSDDPPIDDRDAYVDMDFRRWYDLSGSTGLSFTEIWRQVTYTSG
jgi:hypothetical protein